MGMLDRMKMMMSSEKDIELPNESGTVDPRIPRTGEALKHAMKVFRDINDRAAERKRK